MSAADTKQAETSESVETNLETFFHPLVLENMRSEHDDFARRIGLSFVRETVSFVVRVTRPGDNDGKRLSWIDPYTGELRNRATHSGHRLFSVSNRGHALLDFNKGTLKIPTHFAHFEKEVREMKVGESALVLIRDCPTDVLFIDEPVTFVFGRRRIELNVLGSRRVLIKSVARRYNDDVLFIDRSWGYLPEGQVGGILPDYMLDMFTGNLFHKNPDPSSLLVQARMCISEKEQLGMPLHVDQLG